MWQGFKKRRSANAIIGIDVQDDGVAFAYTVAGEGRNATTSLRCEFIPNHGNASLNDSIAGFVSQHKLEGCPVTLVLPPSQYSLLPITSAPMSQAETRAAARWKIGDLIDFPANQAVIDVFEYPESGQRGTERKLYAVVTKTHDIEYYVNEMRESELVLNAIDIPELAIRNVVAGLPEDEQGVMVLNLMERSGLLVFVKQQEVYLARRFDLGFNDLMDNDVERFDAVVLELQRSLDFFESHFVQALPAKCLIFPPYKVSTELLNHVNNNMRLHSEPLIVEQIPGLVIDVDEESQSRCLQAIGAALRSEENIKTAAVAS